MGAEKWAVLLLTSLQLYNFQRVYGQQYTISSKPEVFTSIPGKTLKLPCFVKNAGAYKTVQELNGAWWKKQGSSDTQGNHSRVNEARTIHPPFNIGPTRFAVSIQELSGAADINTSTRMDLIITDLKPSDSGKYQCSLMEQNDISTVIHTVQVYKKPDLTLEARTDADAAESTNVNATAPGGSMVFRETLKGSVCCRAKDVYPDPQINMYIGEQNVTTNFTINLSGPFLSGSVQNLRTIHYTDELCTKEFRVTDVDHMKELRCQLDPGVVGAGSLVTTMTLYVEYKPKLKCNTEQQANIGSLKFQMKCYFKAYPHFTKVQWTSQTTRETVTEKTQTKYGLTATVTRLNSSYFMATLTFDKIEQQHHQKYKLLVSNALGTSTVIISLEEPGTGSATKGGLLTVDGVTALGVLLFVSLVVNLGTTAYIWNKKTQQNKTNDALSLQQMTSKDRAVDASTAPPNDVERTSHGAVSSSTLI